MHEAFSFNREYDYVRLDGLARATGRPAHEWDLYIVKELIDNALDADESLWRQNQEQFPSLQIHIEYISVPELHSQQLLVRVTNRALFPVNQIQDIFATQWYTSRKAFIKGLTRGALGNALKTLLGIPYALHKRVADDWKPAMKPLSIWCEGVEYLPRYIIDSTAQTIHLEYEKRPCKQVIGTAITVGLDYFVQEKPRTLSEIEELARQYALCNPHAKFQWTVEIENQVWASEYKPRPGWNNKLRTIAPIQWYSLTDFKDLLGALYRGYAAEKQDQKLPIQKIYQYFAGSGKISTSKDQSPSPFTEIIQHIGQDTLSAADIESPLAKALYVALTMQSSFFHPSKLGYLSQEHISAVLSGSFSIDGNLHYVVDTEADNDPSMPFVIEAAAAYLKEGKRQIWTAINFAPTYGDPFLSRWLPIPLQPDVPVLGLRGLLDAYGFREDTSVLLFLHLICPNIEHNEFSKTDINHLPFKKVVGDVQHKLLTELRQGHEEAELQLEQTIFQALDVILGKLDQRERFIPDQLLERLRQELRQRHALAAWLEKPDTINRLRLYIANYQNYNPTINRFVARQSEAYLYVPIHPDQYFSIPVGLMTHDLLERHFVNKIVYVQAQELGPVFVDNNWLCRMDMALLHAPAGATTLEDALLQCTSQCDLPILVLHNSKDDGYALLEQMRRRLKKQHIDDQRIKDLSQHESTVSKAVQPTQLMPGDLEDWLMQRFEALGITVKYLPYLQLRRDIRVRFEQLLQGFLLEGIGQEMALTNLIMALDKTLCYTKMMIDRKLDQQIEQHIQHKGCTESYATVLNAMVEECFDQFMNKHGALIQQMEHTWLKEELDGKAR